MTWAAAIAGTLMDDSSWTSRWFPLLSIWNKEHRGLWGSWGQVRRHLEASSWLRETAQPWAPGERAQHRQNSSLGVAEGRVCPSTEESSAGLVHLCVQTGAHGEGLQLPLTPNHGGFPWQYRCATKILYKVELMLRVLREGGNAAKPKSNVAFHFLPPFIYLFLRKHSPLPCNDQPTSQTPRFLCKIV